MKNVTGPKTLLLFSILVSLVSLGTAILWPSSSKAMSVAMALFFLAMFNIPKLRRRPDYFDSVVGFSFASILVIVFFWLIIGDTATIGMETLARAIALTSVCILSEILIPLIIVLLSSVVESFFYSTGLTDSRLSPSDVPPPFNEDNGSRLVILVSFLSSVGILLFMFRYVYKPIFTFIMTFAF